MTNAAFGRLGMAHVPEATWRRQKGFPNIYLSPSSPDSSLSLLQREAASIGPLIGKGTYSRVYSVLHSDPGLAVKETVIPVGLDKELVSRKCGLAALKLNVAVSIGLARIGENAVLPNGNIITAPDYYGAYISDHLLRILMSQESGAPIYEGDNRAGTHMDRVAVFSAALQAVGVSPVESGVYDDIPTDNTDTNLFYREDQGQRPEIVAIDLSDLGY